MVKICIAGRKRSGKDLSYKIINLLLAGYNEERVYDILDVELYYTAMIGYSEVHKSKFAKPLYKLMSKLTGVDIETIEYNKEMNCVLGMTFRDAMKEIGGAIRRVNEDAFVHQALKKKEYIITDCRYPNEARAAMDNGALVVKLENVNDEKKDDSISETSVDLIVADEIIKTEGELTPQLISSWANIINSYGLNN